MILIEDLERLAAEENEFYERLPEGADFPDLFERHGVDFNSCYPFFTNISDDLYVNMCSLRQSARVELLSTHTVCMFIFGLVAGRQYRKEVKLPTRAKDEKPQRDPPAEGPSNLEAH